jgi:hypothetical protein
MFLHNPHHDSGTCCTVWQLSACLHCRSLLLIHWTSLSVCLSVFISSSLLHICVLHQTLLQVCEHVKITWSQVWTVGRTKKKKKVFQAKSEFRNRNTAHTSESVAFLLFLLIFKYNKFQKKRLSLSFTCLVTKRIQWPINLKVVQFINLCKHYAQTAFTFWMTFLLHKPVTVLYELSISQQWLQRGLKMGVTHSSKMLTDFIRLYSVLSQKIEPFKCSSISKNMNMLQH